MLSYTSEDNTVQIDMRYVASEWDNVRFWKILNRLQPAFDAAVKTDGDLELIQDDPGKLHQFVLAMVCTTKLVGVDYTLPSLNAAGDELLNSFKAWFGLSHGVYTRWAQIIQEVMTDFNQQAKN